jgi:NDP-sugar pyrophosphorylase family protein
MNVLILAAGQSESNSEDGNYPLCLAEIRGVPLVERLVHACMSLATVHLIVAFRRSDIEEFHLDNILEILAPNSKIVSASKETRGAACTALLATGDIDNAEELLIISGNEFIDIDYATIVDDFRRRGLDAGTVTFPSIHPRYSYVRLSDSGSVIEAAERRPISRHATAGFYWFARGSDFVRAAQAMISKDAAVNGNFYVCPVLNELVLEQARIGQFAIDIKQYSPLKTARQIWQEDMDVGKRSHQ